MRICSLLPSATEILFELGLGDSVVGVTHECDFPAEAAKRPALIRPRVDPTAAPAEIDRQVMELVARGESIYAVDAGLLASLHPDLIVTQDLCHVCAASPDDLATALTRLPKAPQVLSLTPRRLRDVWDDIRRVGEVAKRFTDAGVIVIASFISPYRRDRDAVRREAAAQRLRPNLPFRHKVRNYSWAVNAD